MVPPSAFVRSFSCLYLMLFRLVGLGVHSISARSLPDFIARCENSQVSKHKDTGWNKKYKHNILYIFYFNPSRCIYIVLKFLQMYIDLHMLFFRNRDAASPHRDAASPLSRTCRTPRKSQIVAPDHGTSQGRRRQWRRPPWEPPGCCWCSGRCCSDLR